MSKSSSITVADLFDAERPNGDNVIKYKDWELPLSDGTKLAGCTSTYVVVERLGLAYCEIYLDVAEPSRCAEIIGVLVAEFAADPGFLLPEVFRKNQFKIGRNDQDVMRSILPRRITRTLRIYAEARLDLSVKERLVETWRKRKIDLTIFDQNYVEAEDRRLRPYAFMCHSWEDKQAIVRPLSKRLRKSVGLIWYDEYSLDVGDSLRESIEKGIKESDRCVIVLSKAFLKNESWAKREFDSIYTREIVEKKKVLLPVWVDVSREDLYDYSPILAERVGVMWSEGIDNVVEKLAKALRKD